MKSTKKHHKTKWFPPLGEAMPICERKRTYHFPGGDIVVLHGLVEIIVRESGSHRVKTADGKFHIIASGWIHIEIERCGDWAF